LIDWANIRIRSGVDDVASHICRFWTPDVQRDIETDMARLHYDGLVSAGVVGFTWEQHRYDYRLAVMEQVYKRAWRSRYLNWDELGFWVCENILAAYDALECGEFLE
jgi:hypothetical protein